MNKFSSCWWWVVWMVRKAVLQIFYIYLACEHTRTHSVMNSLGITKLVGQRRKSTDFHESLHLCVCESARARSVRCWHKFMIWLHNKWNVQSLPNGIQITTKIHNNIQEKWLMKKMNTNRNNAMPYNFWTVKKWTWKWNHTQNICLLQIDKLILCVCVFGYSSIKSLLLK